jgi:hypothetical protein
MPTSRRTRVGPVARSRVGFWRLMRVFAERQVILTIYSVGVALERNPQAVETMPGTNQ